MKTFKEYLKQKTLREYPECLQELTRKDIVEMVQHWHDNQVKLFAIPDVSESCIQFAIWVQDNYSQNEKQGSKKPLPKGKMRKDFTNDIFTISEIWERYNSR